MAEDGMLLNFSAVEAASSYQPKVRGGSWKERLVVKRLTEHRQHQRSSHGRSDLAGDITERRQKVSGLKERSADFPTPRPAKRPRRDEEFTPVSSQAVALTSTDTDRGNPKAHGTSKPREVISSLFSYNAKPTTVPQQSSATASASAQPSNAPLVDGADTFASLGLSNSLANFLITKLELRKPTAIQKSSLSQLLKEDSDAFIQAETGSGKTLAYLLPLLQRLMSLSAAKNDVEHEAHAGGAVHRDSGLFAILLAPTRELCKQISVVLERLLGCARWLVCGTVIGGEKKKSEKARLRKGLNILVATPGRLADHLDNTKVLDVRDVRWLVLDEGDRLMDLGFEDEIQKIVKKLDQGQKPSGLHGLPPTRTTILCSATMKMNVQRLGEISLKDAVLIKPDVQVENETRQDPATAIDSKFYAPAQLRQSYSVVAAKLRLVTLTALLKHSFARKGSVMKAIVFLSCADSVDFHYAAFSRPSTQEADDSPTASLSLSSSDRGIPFAESHQLSSSTDSPPIIYRLHGSLPQTTRTSVLRHFSANTRPSILFATDVASRGLDLPNLDLVIEYDPPFSSEDHLHRIGRTARLGRDGRASIFLLPGSEEGYVEVLRSSYNPSSCWEGVAANVTHTDCNDILRRGFSPTKGVVSKADPNFSWESQATAFQLECERWVLSSAEHREMAKKAFQSYVRAYATHASGERHYFDIKQLHLGHLAKAFGLRDAPARLNVQGTRGKKNERKVLSGHKGDADDGKAQSRGKGGAEENKHADEVAHKMRRKMKEMGRMSAGAGEFNIA